MSSPYFTNEEMNDGAELGPRSTCENCRRFLLEDRMVIHKGSGYKLCPDCLEIYLNADREEEEILNPKNMTPTKEEMERYELEVHNHNAFCDNRLKFAETVIELVKQFGPERATEKVKNVISEMRFMDAPNKPGYYRANND